jgi:hypothetical protein
MLKPERSEWYGGLRKIYEKDFASNKGKDVQGS